MNESNAEFSLASNPVPPVPNGDRTLTCTDDDESELARRFEPQINRLARHYARGNRCLQQDLAQEGLIGLVNAHRNFKPGGGASFPTFADRHIRGRMKNFVRSERRHNCCVSMSQEYRLEADHPGAGDDSSALLPDWSKEASDQLVLLVDIHYLQQLVKHGNVKLSTKQREVLQLHFEGGLTVGEIARKLKVSPARVSQVLAAVVEKLRVELIQN